MIPPEAPHKPFPGDFSNEPTLGTWSYDRRDWGAQEDTVSQEAIRTAYDLGVRKYDTAYAYGNGHSETLLARSLGRWLGDCFIATKLGPKGKKANFYRGIEASLERLRMERIDLFYLHWPSSRIELRPSLEAMAEARNRGLVRFIGVCNCPHELLDRLHAHVPLDAVQDGYNLLWRKPEGGVIDFCRANGIAFEAYSPLAQGVLSSPTPGPGDFAPEDKRKNLLFFDPAIYPAVRRATEEIHRIAGKYGLTLLETAYGWLTSSGRINSVILGYRNSRQVQEGLDAYSASLPPDALDEIEEISDTLKEVIDSKIPGHANFFGYTP